MPCRRNQAIFDCEYGRGEFQSARGPEQVPMHGFGGADWRCLRVGAEYSFDCGSFYAVVCQCRGSMGVDIAHLGRSYQGALQRSLHGPCLALHGRPGNVLGIRAEAVSRELAMNSRATTDRAVPRFKNGHRRTFAQHEAASILGEWLA